MYVRFMKTFLVSLVVVLSINTVINAQSSINKDTLPSSIKGNFSDDYGIRYTISDTLWTQHPNVNYHILHYDTAQQYLLLRNDDKNPSEPGLFTHIDLIQLSNMAPFHWGFCLTTYNATTIEDARSRSVADRNNPRKGCNGYPFSRMKRSE